jgi:hypothetical protein
MKIKSDMWQVASDKKHRPARSKTIAPRHSSLVTRHSEKGIALVITLILLSVTLVMAIAFLAISRRERNSVTTTTDAAVAKLAADSALAHAEAQIIANVFATTNPYNFGLLVSTNFINANGFVAAGGANPTNVSYVYGNGNPLNNSADLQQNLANLLYSPRPPVFIVTNSQTSAREFRFYLDLNRNGLNDPNGLLPVISSDPANPYYNTNGVTMPNIIPGNTLSNFMVGDPEWIGQLARPDLPHGPNNFFVARYAFFAAPAGNTLDLNYIHNQVFDQANANPTVNLPPTGDNYFRNEGVGSWEINLAAFLADLNTNQWGQDIDLTANYYQYNQPFNFSQNKGRAFDDARALLAYRYNNDYNTLSRASVLFPNGGLMFGNDNIDGYSDGALMTNTFLPGDFGGNDDPTKRWVGADNTNHFFTSQELFDTSKTATGVSPAQIAAGQDFSDRLNQAGAGISTYDRYTFYRLLSQLGTDSEPERGKLNLNYANVDTAGNIVPNMETNLIAWNATQFFTNAADRLLRLYTTNWFQSNPSNYLATYYGIHTNYYYQSTATNDPTGLGLTNIPLFGMTNQVPAFGVTNIPVLVNGNFVYSSSVNRLLQLVANIYDATTNRYYDNSLPLTPLPTVFQPVFSVQNGNVYITNFVEVNNVGVLANQWLNLNGNPGVVAALALQPYTRLMGVPLIIGAKKGFPNFNQIAMQSAFQLTRKLQLTRQTTNAPLSSYKVNQMFGLNTFNQLEVECWNSYASNYTRPTDIYVTNYLSMTLTNDEGFFTNAGSNPSGSINLSGPINPNPWPGYASGNAVSWNPASFQIPLNTNIVFVPSNSVYIFSSRSIVSDANASVPFESNGLASVVVNGSSYSPPHWWLIITNNIQVAMVDRNTQRLIDYVQLSGPNVTRDINDEIKTNSLWLTNYEPSSILPPASLPAGIEAQLIDSTKSANWDPKSAKGFNRFIGTLNDGSPYGATNLEFEAYSPSTMTVQFITWQANDPLVHYMAQDLFDSANEGLIGPQPAPQNPLIATNVPNERYQPWGLGPVATMLALKDPLAWSSDYWDFPANKFPTVGWLGRVHRGTPWQTVYLKATDILKPNGTNVWMNWTGNFNTGDAVNAAPVQDRLLFDVFTTALNDNATRGQLSVNVAANANDSAAGLAAWSALFSGVMVLANATGDPTLTTVSQRAAQYPRLHKPLPPSYTVTNTASPINPAGVNGLNSLLGQLVTNINFMRANFTNADGLVGVFEHTGDILSAPQLTEQSPFLHLNNAGVADTLQQQFGISDEVYEWLPQQAMSLLRCPTAPRYVLYCYGQTLKPAQNSLVTGGLFFGMCTNYQIVSEAVVRAVIRVDDANTSHPRAVIESYNLLPPD